MRIEQLHKLFLESAGVSTDTRKIEPNCLFFALKGDHFNGNTFAAQAVEKGAKYAIVDELLIDRDHDRIIRVDDVLKTLQELATYHRNYLKIPVLALTGSNGKTTTKELINTVLTQKFKVTATKGNLNNHIGVPLTLLSMNSETQFGLVEMGANHQKEIELLSAICQPDYGYITNYGKAHLEGFGGFEGVINGKSELYENLRSREKIAFVNADDPLQMEKSQGIDRVLISDHLEGVPIEILGTNPSILLKIGNTSMVSHLMGTYNARNIRAALAIGHFFKVPLHDLKMGIETYEPDNNRSQWLKTKRNLLLLDAYNANPSSMSVALRNFSVYQDPKVNSVILGDMFELGQEAPKEHQSIGNLALELGFKNVFLVGENFYAANTQKGAVKCREFEDLSVAIQRHDLANQTIMVKGSRGMALERIVDLL